MDDLISRQAAIDALANTKDLVDVTWTDENDNVIDSIEEKRNIIANWLEKVPSAQPEEVTPHRNYQYLSDYWCECGWHLGKMGDVNYCPNCGKKVKWDG